MRSWILTSCQLLRVNSGRERGVAHPVSVCALPAPHPPALLPLLLSPPVTSPFLPEMAGLFIFSERWLTVDCLFTPSGMQRQRECWLATCWQNPRVVKKLKQSLVVWPATCFHCWGSCTGECLFSLYAVNTCLPLCVSKPACLLTDPYLVTVH